MAHIVKLNHKLCADETDSGKSSRLRQTKETGTSSAQSGHLAVAVAVIYYLVHVFKHFAVDG